MIGTKYQKSRRTISDYPYSVIKRPKSYNKLGWRVSGKYFQDYAMYSLTLEERATCPTTCQRWADCYGNNMPFAHRLQHGLDLEHALFRDVGAACRENPRGVLVRLHVLGDFYSPEYVGVWEELLATHDNLAAFGYTHRNDPACPIHQAIADCKMNFGVRFYIRWSDMPDVPDSASHETIAAPDAITCPEQIGKAKNCAACGLCWNAAAEKIRFIHH